MLIGVSGGADSIALLNILIALMDQLGLTIGVAHLNHELRGEESDRDSDFVKAVSGKTGFPIHIKNVDVQTYQQVNHLSPEDAARKVRYNFFHEVAEKNGYDRIATAHTANDNAELVLMNLFRGSGPSGLGGIPVKRGKIIRPFINESRESIINYLNDNNLDYVTDSSNTNRDYLRNRVRLDLLPLIKTTYNENIIDCLNRTSTILRDEEAWIDELILPVFQKSVTDQQTDSISLSIDQLGKEPVAVKRRIIRKAIGTIKGDLKKITLFHTDLIANMMNNTRSHFSVDLPGRIQAQKKRTVIILTRHSTSLRDLHKSAILYEYRLERLEENETTIHLPDVSMKMVFSLQEHNKINYSDKKTAWLDLNHLTFPLTIRNPRSGDRFIPLGMTGSQTLKKFFSGISVSGNDKNRCPVLVSKNDIIWIGGHRIDNRYRLRPGTKNILKVELFLD